MTTLDIQILCVVSIKSVKLIVITNLLCPIGTVNACGAHSLGKEDLYPSVV